MPIIEEWAISNNIKKVIYINLFYMKKKKKKKKLMIKIFL